MARRIGGIVTGSPSLQRAFHAGRHFTPIRVVATDASQTIAFDVIAPVFTQSQRHLLAAGGMPRQVVDTLVNAAA